MQPDTLFREPPDSSKTFSVKLIGQFEERWSMDAGDKLMIIEY